MSRKDTLRAILSHRGEQLPPGNSANAPESKDALHAPALSRVSAGAVGIMSRSLGQIAHAAEEARALIAGGNAVVEIPTNQIDASFITDRFEGAAADHAGLVQSIRERGQQVPILVRPHPEDPDRYQLAYGHRRLRALAELDMPIRAVVLALSDEELVVAQGQENSARKDLSYIERARFAVALEVRGFSRQVIMSALNMEKTQLSRLLALGRAIPAEIAKAIGSAPKAGRPRWAAFSERLEKLRSTQALSDLFATKAFLEADSDTRFVRAIEAIAPKKTAKTRTSSWKADDGHRVATIERAPHRVAIIVDEKDAPQFGEFLATQIPDLYRAFQHQRGEGPEIS